MKVSNILSRTPSHHTPSHTSTSISFRIHLNSLTHPTPSHILQPHPIYPSLDAILNAVFGKELLPAGQEVYQAQIPSVMEKSIVTSGGFGVLDLPPWSTLTHRKNLEEIRQAHKVSHRIGLLRFIIGGHLWSVVDCRLLIVDCVARQLDTNFVLTPSPHPPHSYLAMEEKAT